MLEFEGNAQGFRTLCVLQNQPQLGGLQLTHAVLGAFTKYPRESVVAPTQKSGISGKKFGFMQSEAGVISGSRRRAWTGKEKWSPTGVASAPASLSCRGG